MESCPTQAVLPLVGFAAEKVIRGRHGRAYNLSTSKDFVHWSKPRFFFGTDDEDQARAVEAIRRRLADPGLARPLFIDPDPAIGWRPPGGKSHAPTWRAECYNIGVFRYEGVYLAWFMVYYPTGQRLPERRNTDGFKEIQLAMTRDLTEWKRLGNRQPLLSTSRIDEKGLVGNYDRLQLGVTNHPIHCGDELWFYYFGMKRRVPQHDRYTDGSPRAPSTLSESERADWLEDTHSAIHLAALRQDGFVSLDAGQEGGYVVTKPLELHGEQLHLNVDAGDAGSAVVEILNASGEPLAGFSKGEGRPLTGDSVRLPVSWRSGAGLNQLEGRTVRLRIHLRSASLYAFWTE